MLTTHGPRPRRTLGEAASARFIRLARQHVRDGVLELVHEPWGECRIFLKCPSGPRLLLETDSQILAEFLFLDMVRARA